VNIIEKAVNDANTAYFNLEQDREAVNAKREVDIERIAIESMLPGGECYPWSKENFSEIINQLYKGSLDGDVIWGDVLLEAKRVADIVAAKNYKD